MGSLLLSGAAFAQDDEPARDGRHQDRHFRLPPTVVDNPDVRECILAYRESLAAFKTAMAELRKQAEGANEEELARIKSAARELAKSKRQTANEIRKKIRRIRHQARKDRATDSGDGS